MQQGSYPIGSRVININTDNATGVVTGATCDIPLNALAVAIQQYLGLTLPLVLASGGTGATTAPQARTNLGLGSIATQNSNSVTITGGAIDGTPIGLGTPSTGAFTTLTATSPIPVSSGGTGANTFTAHGVLLGEGSGAIVATGAGVSGQPLLSGGPSADPAYGTLGVSGGGTGATSAGATAANNIGALAIANNLSDVNSKTTATTNLQYLQGATGSVARSLTAKFQDVVSAKDFGAVGNGIADDTAAIQAALNYVATVGGEVYLPNGTYNISSSLTMDTGVYTRGISLRGAGRNTIINVTAAGVDAIKFSTTQFLQNSWIRDLQVTNTSSGGHLINIVYGCTTCFIDNVELTQLNTAKSCIYGDYSVSGGGVYDTKFRGGNWVVPVGSTVPGVQFKANGTIVNENLFENLRLYNATGTQFFNIGIVAGSNWLTNNTFKNLNFEVCKGGAFQISSFKNCNFQNISFWDASGAYTQDIILMTSGTGLESVANTFTNVARNGDTVTAGKYDINIQSGQDTVIVNCYTQTGDSPVYNFNNKRLVWIGKPFGTVSNTAGLTIINSIDGIRFPGTVNGASLNYYDEGTWTATLGGSTTDPTTPVTSTGRWTRVGRIVRVEVTFLNVTTTGASGQVVIRGLPFAPAGVNGMGLVGLSGLGANAAVGIATTGATTVSLVQQASIGATIAYGAGTGQFVYLSMEYTV